MNIVDRYHSFVTEKFGQWAHENGWVAAKGDKPVDFSVFVFIHDDLQFFLASSKAKRDLSDPSYFTDSSQRSTEEDAAQSGIPINNSFIIDFWEKAPPSALDNKKEW